jgi:prepilin-type N-terminal cleavage/methylation domain-containing protein
MIAKSHCRRGYTLVEVLVVVSIIGIIGAIVVPQMIEPGNLRVQAATRAIVADLLVAQNEAIAHQSPRRVIFEPAQGRYRIADHDGISVVANWQSGAVYVVDFTNDSRFAGVSIQSVDFSGQLLVEFDELGAPSSGGTIDLVAGRTHYRISMAPFTGRITIAAVLPEE